MIPILQMMLGGHKIPSEEELIARTRDLVPAIAARADETERLYDKTTNRGVKSQVSWALAAAFAVNGVRLVLTNGSAATAASSPSHERASRPVWIEPWLAADRLGLRLGRALGSE